MCFQSGVDTRELELEEEKKIEDYLPDSMASIVSGFPWRECTGCW